MQGLGCLDLNWMLSMTCIYGSGREGGCKLGNVDPVATVFWSMWVHSSTLTEPFT
jgi:hypothetical protein